MSLVRSSLVIAVFVHLAACTAAATTEETESEIIESTASELKAAKGTTEGAITIASEDGVCTPFRKLVHPRRAEIRALCSDEEVALPDAIDHEGCEARQVKSVTFGCYVPPPGVERKGPPPMRPDGPPPPPPRGDSAEQ